MPLTRDFKETVNARIQKDSTFATALLNEAISLFFNGEPETARLILRDLINSTIGFEELAAKTSKPSKSLHRMLSAKGNLTMDNLTTIINVLREKLDLEIKVQIISPKLSKTTYKLEYWIERTKFSKEDLEKHIKQKLGEFLPDTKFEIKENAKNLLLHIISTETGIGYCYNKLEFQQEWSFRMKDELGDLLRSEAYPILAEIELRLRNFISQAMIEVFGFDWWNLYISKNYQGTVKKDTPIEKEDQVKLHHPIEFTFFDQLIAIITDKFQNWTDDKAFTVNDFSELLSKCNSIEDLKQEINNHRKIISYWDNVFFQYFDDKNAWIQLEKNIKKQIIPLRNKVMHHRLIRRYELQKLEECRDEMRRLLDSAKPNLSDVELEEIQPSVKTIMKSFMAPPIKAGLLKAMSAAIQSDSFMKAISAPAAINSELLKAMSASIAINEASG